MSSRPRRTIIEPEADHRADHRADDEREDGGFPALIAAHHREQLHVAEAHALLLADELVAGGDGPEEPAADGDADERALEGELPDDERHGRGDPERRDADHVGNDLVIDVDERDRDVGGAENRVERRDARLEAVSPDRREE